MDRIAEMEIFLKVADAGSLSRAADALDISASRVSRALVALETRLGTALVRRTTRQFHLTPEGEAFCVKARDILSRLAEAEASVSATAHEPSGVLKVRASLSFSLLHLVPVIERFRRRHPLVRVEVETSNRYFDAFEQGFDLVIRTRRAEPDSTVTIRKLAEVPRLLVAAPAYLARRGAPVLPADLSDHDLLLYTLSEDWDHLSLSKGETSLRMPVTAAMAANDGFLLRHAALSGMGILAQPAYVLADDLRAGRLVQVLPDWALPRLTINVAFPSSGYLTARTRLFVDALIQHFRENGFERKWMEIGTDDAAARAGEAG